MRLINTATFKLRDFGSQPPPYAILSHTWGGDEVTFQDMADLDAARNKLGFAKIEQCCRRASLDGFDWAWVDTCCIDESSSAELSETINSMFKWYERAMKCYAFLSDVSDSPGDELFHHHHHGFLQSRWWTRGWTLQELIAPHDVEFYNRDWEYLTSKREYKEYIGSALRIAGSALDQSRALSSFCMAERMSWACRRQTTREEDLAYCLLGILDVNMPLLYGEGGLNAFLRLQQQVLNATEDYTLFLWSPGLRKIMNSRRFRHLRSESPPRRVGDGLSPALAPIDGVLASSPSDFAFRGGWSEWSYDTRGMLSFGEAPQVTSRGLRLSLFVREVTHRDLSGTSEIATLLDDYFIWLFQQGFRTFVDWLRPTAGRLAHPLFLGALPCVGTSLERMPCMLLLDPNSFRPALAGSRLPSRIGGESHRTYVKLSDFLARLPASTLSDNWKLTTCSIWAETTRDTRRSQSRNPNISPSDFFTWRTPRPNISCSFGASPALWNGAERRWSFHLLPSGMFQGCLILIATQPEGYWLAHRVGKTVDLDAELVEFDNMDLSRLWVKTTRESGPVCEQRVDLGTASLLITLWIETFVGSTVTQYRAYLAFIKAADKRPQPPEIRSFDFQSLARARAF